MHAKAMVCFKLFPVTNLCGLQATGEAKIAYAIMLLRHRLSSGGGGRGGATVDFEVWSENAL